MEVVLTNEDIEELIKKSFSGVKEVKFNYKIVKAILEVDRSEFFTIPVRTGTLVPKEKVIMTPPVKKVEPTLEQDRALKQAEELNKAQNERNDRNRMARPGEERPLPVVG